jgi:2-isopropylmalate synthase
LKTLTETSRYVAEVSNVKQRDSQPFGGNTAFTHKGGRAYQRYDEESRHIRAYRSASVGNKRKLVVSEMSGKSSIMMKARSLELDLESKANSTKKILRNLQKLEHEGYHFESRKARLSSYQACPQKIQEFLRAGRFQGSDGEQGQQAPFGRTIKVKVNKVIEHTAAEGDGPVNALDAALRKALMEFYPSLAEMRLSDFRVRVLDEKAGTAAKVRVLIQSSDSKDSWWTIGVSENIIEASWEALVDSIEYKLLKDHK